MQMFMEAVTESTKDRDIRNPQVEQPTISNVITMSVEPSDRDDSQSHGSSHEISKPVETESSLVKHSMHSTTQTTSAASDVCEPLKAESNSIAVIHSQKLVSEPSPAPLLDTSSGNTENASSSHSDSSASLQCSSDTDISHNTKATLTVIRNPAGLVMNGLMRRWDFNFFRNSHNNR